MPDLDYLLTMRRPMPSGVIPNPEWVYIQCADGSSELVNYTTGERMAVPDNRSDYEKALDELDAEFPGIDVSVLEGLPDGAKRSSRRRAEGVGHPPF